MTVESAAMTLIDAAIAYRDAGLSVVATHDKVFVGSAWRQFQERIATDDQILDMFTRPGAEQIAVVCGAVSGGLECLDFDAGGEVWPAWAEMIEGERPGLLARLYMERSPRGGRHLVYRISGIDVPPQKLHAGRPGSKKVEVLIETRGEGNYFVCCPFCSFCLFL